MKLRKLISILAVITTLGLLAGCSNLLEELQNMKKQYTLSFNANGGTGTMAAQSVPEESTITLPTCKFTSTGYAFAGWATSATANSTISDGASYTMPSADVTLYAKWKKNLSSAKEITAFNLSSNTGTISGT